METLALQPDPKPAILGQRGSQSGSSLPVCWRIPGFAHSAVRKMNVCEARRTPALWYRLTE